MKKINEYFKNAAEVMKVFGMLVFMLLTYAVTKGAEKMKPVAKKVISKIRAGYIKVKTTLKEEAHDIKEIAVITYMVVSALSLFVFGACIWELADKNEILNQQVVEMEAEIADLDKIIAMQQNSNNLLEEEIAELTEENKMHWDNMRSGVKQVENLKAEIEELENDKENHSDILHSDYVFNHNDLDMLFNYYDKCMEEEGLTFNEATKLRVVYEDYYNTALECLEEGNDKLALAIAYEFMECAVANIECGLGQDHSGMFHKASASEIIEILVLEMATR